MKRAKWYKLRRNARRGKGSNGTPQLVDQTIVGYRFGRMYEIEKCKRAHAKTIGLLYQLRKFKASILECRTYSGIGLEQDSVALIFTMSVLSQSIIDAEACCAALHKHIGGQSIIDWTARWWSENVLRVVTGGSNETKTTT